MRKKRVAEAPKCSFDSKDAKYDAPTMTGQWAFMCPECFMSKGNDPQGIGCEFIIGIAEAVSGAPLVGTLDIEKTMESDTLIVTCPCTEERHLELDAEGEYQCEGCGRQVTIPSLF